MARYLLAHDLGTSGNKATLFSQDGQLVASQTVSYPTHYFNGNWAQQDPQDWWQAVCTATAALVAKISADQIAAVTLSGQMMGCTPVDRQGRVLRPSLLYCDQRASEQASRIASRLSPERFYGITGHRLSPGYTLAKLAWIRDHEPAIWAQTYKTLCAKDFINFQLTGRMATDYSDASGTNAFDLNTFTWSQEVLKAADLDESLFPEALPSTAVLGEVTSAAAAATGLRAGTPVVVGGGDGSCAGVGVGCIAPGQAYNYLGSSSWIALTVEKPIVDPLRRTMNWAHCVPGYLHPSGTMQAAGASYAWAKNVLGEVEAREAELLGQDVYERLNKLVSESPPGANGLLFLPHMLGERTPRWNPEARGCFVGLTLATRRADLLRAVLEGITMNLGLIVRIFRGHVPVNGLRIIGGGARGRLWRQMMADIYDCPTQRLNFDDEATSMGAAVIGGVGVGLFKDFRVIDQFVQVTETLQPDAKNRVFYEKLLGHFDACYQRLEPTFGDLAGIAESK